MKKRIQKKENKLALQELRRDVRIILEQVIDMLGISVTANQVILAIFEEKNGEVERRWLINFFVRHVPEPHFINTVFRLVNTAWFLFPHQRLDGKAPIEMPWG